MFTITGDRRDLFVKPIFKGDVGRNETVELVHRDHEIRHLPIMMNP